MSNNPPGLQGQFTFAISASYTKSLASEKHLRQFHPTIDFNKEEILLSVKITGITEPVIHKFKIVPSLPVDLYFGIDFIEAHQCVRNPIDRTWTLKGQRLLTTFIPISA